MVAEVSGAGLGLFGSSVSALGGAGASGNAGLGRGTDRVFVNTATGNLVVQSQDEVLSALGLDLSLIRTYNSQGLLDDDNQDNWRLGVQQRVFGLTGTVNTANSTIKKTFGDGREVLYAYDATRLAYVSTEGDGAHDTLAFASSQWTWTDGSARNLEVYNSSGQLLQSRDADLNTVTYTYDASSRLTQIADASGQTTFLDYTGTSLNIDKIRVVSNGQTQTLTRYTYDGSNRLTQVTVDLSPSDNVIADGQTYTTTYTYESTSKRIATITQKDGSSVAFTYQLIDGQYRVKTYTDGEGRVTTINYSQPSVSGGSSTSAPANPGALSTTDTVNTSYALNSGALTTPSGGWSTPLALESGSGAASQLQVAGSNVGDAVAAWIQGGSLYARRYDPATHTWGTAAVVSDASTSVTAPRLYVDWDSGNAILTWIDAGNQVRVRRSVWGGSTYAWQGNELLATISGATLSEVTGGINGSGTAAVSWLETNGSTRTIRVRRFSTTWAATESVTSAASAITAPRVIVPGDDVTQLVWRQTNSGTERLYTRGYNGNSGGWGSTLELSDVATGSVGLVRLDTDPWTDVNVVFTQGNDIYSRWGGEGQGWDSYFLVATSANPVTDLAFSSSELNEAVTAWVTSAGEIYVYRNGATAPDLIATGSGLADLAVDANNAHDIIVSWRAGTDHYVARYLDGAWGAPALLASASGAAGPVYVVINENDDGLEDGEVLAVYRQNDGTADSIFATRNTGGVGGGAPYYTVQAGDTWASIGLALYGSSAVASQLQSALANPALTAGAQLTGFPATIVVSTTQTVPAYYTVQAGNTWSSITQTIYGTSDANAIAALQVATGNPTLTTGLHLTVPLTLTYGSGSTLYLQTDVLDALGFTTTYTQDSAGRLTSVLAPTMSGSRIETRYAYDSAGNVTTITQDPTGLNRVTTLTYDANGNLLTSRDSAGNSTARTYNSNNQLLTETRYVVPDPDGAGSGQPTVPLTTRYAYDTENHLRFVISPQGRVTEHVYNGPGQRTATLKYTGGLYTATNFAESDLTTWATAQDRTRLERTNYTYDFRDNLATLSAYLTTDASGNGTGTPLLTQFVYDQRGRLLQTIEPRGSASTPNPSTPNLPYATTYTYDGLGRVLSTTQWVGGSVMAPVLNGGYETGTAAGWPSLPGVITAGTAHSGVYSARADSGAGGPNLITQSFAAAPGEVFRAEAYVMRDPANLPSAPISIGIRAYDSTGAYVGSRITLQSASISIDGWQKLAGTFTVPAGAVSIAVDVGESSGTGYWFVDDVAITRPVTTTLRQYDDATRRTITTAANGAITTSIYNRSGDLISSLQGGGVGAAALSSMTYAYDADGRLRIVTDLTGVRQFYFYDEAGRKRGHVDGNGTLTEYIYDKANALIKTIQYAALVDSTTLASLVDGSGNPTAVTLATVRTAASGNPSQDRITRNVYDTAARLVYSIDEAGAVTQYLYDGAGRVTDEVHYTNTVTIARTVDQLLPSDITVTAASATDRRTRYFYDSDGNLAGKLDGEGYLIEYLYDPAGYLFQQIAYATQTNASFWLAGTLTQLRPAVDNTPSPTPERDINTYFFYDNQGRRIGTLDGEGYLTELVYDPAGNLTQTNRWDKKLTYTAGVSTFATLKTAATAAPAPTAHTTTYQYDGAGRKTQETDYLGIITTYSYDSVGNLIGMTRAATTGEARTTNTNYDLLGRVLAELTAEGRAALDAISNPTQTQITDIWNKYGVNYEYDLAGRRISATVRPNDSQTNKTVYYYDNDGRLRFEVNALGERKEYRYNALNQLTDELVYTTRISTTGLTGGLLNTALITTLTGSTNAQDALTMYTYTLTGQVASKRTVRTALTAEDALVAYTYNAFGEQRVKTDSIDASATLATDLTFDRRGLVTQTRWDQPGLNITEARAYDAFGRLTQITDGRLNIVKRFEYDTLGREVAHTEASTSDRTQTTYDAFSRVLTVRDALLNTTTYSYNEANKSMTLTTPEGVVVTTTFNLHGQKLTVLAAGNTTTYLYDLNGKLTSAYDTVGTLETHTYDRAGRELTRVDARGTTTTYAYDAANRVLTRTEDSATGGLALVTSYTYDGQGRVTRVDEPNGRRTDTTYYRDGRIDTVAVDPTALNLRTRYTYDRTGRVVTVTEGYGSTAPSKPRITQYIYDKLGRRIEEVVDPTALGGTLNLRTQYRYDKSNNLTRKIDARGFSTWYVYDTDNRVTHTIDALGGVTQSTYDLEDRVIATRRYAASIPSATVGGFTDIVTTSNFTISTGTLDSVSRSFFDRDGREKYTINAAGTVTERVFDANGQVTRTRVLVSPALTGTYADAAAVTTALGSAATTVNANDRISWTAYDLRGRAAYSVDGLGKVCRYIYDANGNVVSKTEFATQRSTTAAMDFATLNTAYGSATPAGQDRFTRYWYDATDRLRFTLDPEGYLTEQQYNDAGRLETTISYAAKPTVPATATLAHLIARNNGVVIPADVNVDQKMISAYDAAGRLSRVTDSFNNYEEYTYDATGNKLTYRNKKGSIWDYQYDANGRLTKEIAPLVAVATATETATAVTVAASTNVRLETVMVYDALGNVTSRTEAANVTGASRQTTYDYDALGRQTVTHFPVVNVYNTSGDTQLGNGAAIARTELGSQALYSEVAYDALGNAFRNRDLAGNYSYKIYDVLGRVEYEIDAEKYVTQYSYDVFGNKLTTKRYENALTAALPNNTTSLTSSALTGILVTGADRTVTTGYDRLNRVTQVTQASVSNFLPNNGSSGGPIVTAAAQTLTDYNAFGDVTRTRRLIDPASGGIYADTYFYYDRRGSRTAQVDPLKYLTLYEYDETGDLKRQLEYATALTGTVNFSGYSAPQVTTPSTMPASAVGYDRETLYAYDRLNRKVSETRVGIEHATISGTTVTMATGNQVTTYGYDVLGNQTRVTQVGVLVNGTATDLNTYTYYDVLGRVVAKAEPARNLGNGTVRTPLTVMRLDAYGNVLEQTEYANGAAGTPTEAAIPAAQLVDSTNDRTTRMALDQHGRVIHSEDAKGADRLASYNARGELVKEWQAVTNADSVVEYRTTLYTYDNLGRQLDVTEPQRYNGATTVSVTNRAKYNSFGEVIERGLVDGTATSGKQELFSYDIAGRLWRTNSGDGVTKVYLHDLLGNVTAEIRSQGRNLADNVTYANAAAVAGLTTDVMRTETRYDVLGRVVEQRLPTFTTTSGLEGITATFTIGQVAGPKNPEAVYQRIHTQALDFYVVNPSATIAQNGGYYLSASGAYVQDTSQTIITATRVTWDAPTDASVEAKFEYRVLGSTDPNAWASVPVGILSTNRLSANVSSLMNQTYEYRVSYRRRTETTAYAQASGSFRVDGTISGSVAISQNPPDPASEVATLNVTQTDGLVTWAAPSDTTVVGTVRVRPTGTSTYTDLNAIRNGSNFFVIARDALAVAGTYDYEIVYTRNNATIAKKSGTLTSTGTTNPRTLTGVALGDGTNIPPTDAVPTITAQLSGNIGATIFGSEYSNLGPRPTGGAGNPKPVSWIGGNEIRLNWANVGAGTITVQVDYVSQGWQRWEWLSGDNAWDPQYHDPITGTRSGAATATGATITWTTPTSPDGGGGVSAITAVRVYRDGVQILSQPNPTPSWGRSLNWAPPTDTTVVPKFEYAVANSGSWVELPILQGTTSMGVDLNGVAANLYDYRVTYRIGGRLTAQQTGTLSIVNQSTTTVTSITVTPNSAPAAPSTVASVTGQSGVTLTATVTGSSTRQTVNHNVTWNGTNSVSTTWTDLGNVPVKIVVNYMTKPSFKWVFNAAIQEWEQQTVNAAPRTKDLGVFTNAGTGKGLSWTESGANPGGIDFVTEVSVYTQDGGGNYTVLARSLTGSVPPTLNWTAPPAGVTPTFAYRVSGSGSSWTWVTPQVVGSQLRINLGGVASNPYEYYIGYQRSGESFDASGATGVFTLSGSTITVNSQTAFNNAPTWLSGVTGSGSNVSWTRTPTAGDSVTFEYWNGSSWVARSSSVSGSTYTVNMAGVSAGTYSYRVRYTHSGQSLQYVEGTGTVVVSTTTQTIQASVTPTSQSNQTFAAVPVPVSFNGDTISWSYTRQNAADTVKVTYWVDSGPTQTIANATTFAISAASLVAAGGHTIVYVIEYLRPGETNSYARATGTASFNISYPTVYATSTINSQNAVYPSGMQQIAAPTDLGSNYLGWTTSAVAGATVTFRYQPAAGGAWTELNEEVNGSGFKVNVASIIGGLFNYEILYTRSGESNPYAGASGTLNVTRNTSPTGSTITPVSPTAPTPIQVTPTQRQTIDRWGNVIALTDAGSNTTNYRYNQYGQLIETKQPQVAYTSTASGQVTTGNATPITRNYYDRAGRLIAVQDANGNLTRATLNAVGQVIAETHADGGIKSSTFDAFGQLVAVDDELHFETRSTYDRVGNLTAVAREVTDNVFITDNYAYDEAGRRLSETNAENEITRYYYDLHDNLIRRRSHLNANTTYAYDANDRKTNETDAISGAMTWAYDYFGRMTGHTDLGSANYTYSYTGNYAGLLQQQTTQTGQNVAFVYDSAGHLTQINDTGTSIGRNVTYSYDTAGRRSREKTKINGLTYQDTFIQYDVLNRMSRMTDLRYDTRYSYDLQGNRTNINATYYDHEKRQQTQDLWYTYDNMNRVLISQGANAFGQININTTQGVRLTYNAASQRTSSETYGNLKYRHEELDVWDPAIQDIPHIEHDKLISDYTTESYEYDGLGRLTKTWRESEFYQKRTNSSGQVLVNSTTQTSTLLSNRQYDNASRQTLETTAGIENDDLIGRDTTTVYDDDGKVDIQTARRQDPGVGWQTESIVDFNYDAANVLRTYTVDVYKTGPLNPGVQYRSTYSNSYRLGDSYQDAGQSVSSTALAGGVQVPQSGSTARSYNVNGELISFTDTRDANKSRYFANGAGGQPLLVVQGSISNVPQAFSDALARADNANKSQHFFFANGQSVGSFGQLQGTDGKFKANFDVNYTAISDEYPSSVPVSVVAQENDTLRTIAARVFGDGNLWYVLAEENGLTDPDALIQEGTVIQVPNEVLSVSNASGSFKPFNIADAIGDTSPTQPAPPRPKKKGCGVLGQILMVAVAIVVSVYTAGLATSVIAPTATAAAGSGAAALGSAALSGGLIGASAGAGIAAAAIGGAVGAAASQGLAMAMGMQDRFDWKGVALGAIGAGVTSGIGAAGAAFEAGRTGALASIGRGLNNIGTMGQAAVRSALTQGISVATGLQSSFSWRDVAISAVAAPIASQAGQLASSIPIVGGFAGRFASGVAGSYVRRAFGGRMDTATILADAFGNTLGQGIVDLMQPGEELTPHERRMRAEDRSRSRTNSGGGEWVPPEPVIESPLDNNPDFFANLPMPTVEVVTAQTGDSISTILGTSDPVAIEAFMRANTLSSSSIEAGGNYKLPDAADYAASTGQVGQAVLNQDNTRLAAQAQDKKFYQDLIATGGLDLGSPSFEDSFDRLFIRAIERGWELAQSSTTDNGLAPGLCRPGDTNLRMEPWDGKSELVMSDVERAYRGTFEYQAAIGVQDGFVNLALPEYAAAKVIAGVGWAARTLRYTSAYPEVMASTTFKTATGEETISALVKPVDILAGDPRRVAIIGRSMDAVDAYADALRGMEGIDEVAVFSSKAGTISDDAIREFAEVKKFYNGNIPNNGALTSTRMFSENMRWADYVRSQGYTVIDLGNPFRNPNTSLFYNIEQVSIFGRVPR